jgi:dihydrofolate reductase
VRAEGFNVTYEKDPRVDANIDALLDWQQTICREVRDPVHAADPEVQETIKRRVQPYFVLEGNICALLAAKDHVNVFLLNSLPKYVISSTLESPEWSNTTVLRGEVVEEVTKLKEKYEGDIVVYGSTQLAQTLIEHDLVDAIHLQVYPVIVGAGQRLFAETSATKRLRLAEAKTVGDGVHLLIYEKVA